MSSVIASIVLACPFSQVAPQEKVSDASLFDELIRKTNDLRAFVAVYRLRASDQEGDTSLRITFRAPEDLRVESPGHVLMSLRAGVLDLQASSAEGKPMVAHVLMADLSQERWRKLADAARSEFPESTGDWTAEEVSCGGRLELRISPDGEGTKENFEFRATFACPRPAILAWLDTFKNWKDERTEDDEHVVFRTARGAQLSLSKRTGFIESVKKQNKDGTASFELEHLDLDPKLVEDSFELPAPPPGAADGSAQLAAQFQQLTTLAERKKLVAWISRSVAEGKINWNADARVHVRKVLETLHSEGITLEYEPWITSRREWIDGMESWLHERYSSLAKTDDEARGALESKVREARDKLFDSLQQRLHNRVSSLTLDETAVPDATLRSSLGELEETAVKAAFDHILQSPMLESFDDRVQRAMSGG